VDIVSRTLLQHFGEWAAGLRLGDIPVATQQRVRWQVASVLAAAAAASWHEPSRTVLRARRGRGRSLVFATGDRRSRLDAAFTNASFAMALDFDDYLLSGHTGHSAVLVPLAFARTVADVILAAAVANEFMGRLSTACLLGPVNGQMSSYIHNAGAAAALAKVMGLPADRLATAVALALYQPNLCLTPGFWNEGSKTVTAAQPQEQGIRAAQLAAAGLDGPLDLLEHPLGFPTFFSFASFPGLFEGWGDTWFSDTLCYKRYPGTSYVSAAVEGALRCSGKQPVDPRDIDEVRIETTLLSSTLDSLGAAAIAREPLDANAVNFSLKLSVAVALCLGDLIPDHLRPDRLRVVEDRIRATAEKVTVIHDWGLTARMMAESPVGLRMLASMSPAGLVKSAYHGRRMNRASGARGRNPGRAIGLVRQLPELARGLSKRRGARVSALDLDTTSFRMLQSARTTVYSHGTMEQAVVDVPVGACGRDVRETAELVRWRCGLAFGARGKALMDVVEEPNATVEDLEAVAEPGPEPGF